MQIIFYSTHCPKCHILESKLKEKGLKYEECNDTHLMLQLGFDSMPVLEVDGARMEFGEAVKWIAAQEANK